ncbi:acyltransferase family protein [Adhaeribacter aquaticus]|uniref:acyltransferase family protein n=1 Tax=Adhaeribacter aquaticus TaxID=299567 RepID=UPI0004107006|nr:acyltransferase family protein [Adhaeribacter aquaticus]
MTNKNNLGLNFRYDINALRAIAILGVIFFHYKIEVFEGGFTGVDIFFVISGYLMSRIVIKSINKNEFNFKDYFEKRLKRIVPALLILILTITLIGFFVLFPEDYWLSQKNAAGSVLFLSNILYWRTSDYFAPSSDTNILLHTWSLSVEWQFYILYPIFLLILNKVFNRRAYYIVFFIGLTIILFILSAIYTSINPTASFYLLPTRAWEMMFGGIAYFSEDLIKNIKWRKAIAWIGYTSLLACFLLLNTSMVWPSVYTIFPVFATFLVIIANYNEFKVVKHVSIQFIGKISYSLYLWHWPIYVIAQYFGVQANLGSAALFTLLSIVIGYISFTYIETNKFYSSKIIIAAMVLLCISAACLGYFRLNKFLHNASAISIASYNKNHQKEQIKQFSRNVCHIDTKAEDFNKERCLCIKEGKKNILLIGDSHLAQLSLSLREHLEKRNINLLQLTLSATLPTIEKRGKRNPHLRELMDYIYLDFVPKNAAKIDGVIISAHWAAVKDIDKEVILNDIKEAVNYLKKYNINTIIIGQTEGYTIPYPVVAAKNFESKIEREKYLDDYCYEIDTYLSDNLGASYIKVINKNSFPTLSSKNEPYMFDMNHVTKFGADLVVEKVLNDSTAMNLLNN